MKSRPTFPEDAREACAAYQREWRKRNKDKTRQYMINYWTKKAKEAKSKEEIQAKENDS